jgi:phosphoglucomutase
MDKAIKEKANKWLNSNIDQDAKDEIAQMLESDDQTELIDSFYKDLEFGTGGLRGIIGIGSSRMNKYTIGAATQGLANYLNACYPEQEISVAIAHDSRIKSDFFAETTASIFSANGIKVYFFKELRPTPELSFAIRHFGCQSGVVLTASHNPKEYNGYKAYWNDGAQMVPPHDVNVIKEVAKITDFDMIRFNRDESKIIYIGEEVDNAYLDKISQLVLSPEAIRNQHDLKIVFSPIHGTGITLVPKILDKIGFKNVHIVKEQAEPDGTFPTVVYPNPEESEAMSLALKEAEKLNADIVMATDPDADRVGIAVKNHHGKFQLLNGNQTGSLIVYYLIRRWKENNKLDGDQFIVKTIVTTDIIHRIAEKYQVEYFDTLTGFKYIAEVIRKLEGQKQFIGGGEESYGYMIGDFVRDKDAIASCMVIAEMTAWAKDQGKSLMDILIDMYVEFGFFKEKLISIVKKGMSGAEEIEKMMVQLRENPPSEIAGAKLVKTIDYQASVEKDLEEGTEKAIDFPKSNVLQFITADGSKISARPSGTEPKIKFYFSVNDSLSNKDDFDKVDAMLDERIEAIIQDLKLQ